MLASPRPEVQPAGISSGSTPEASFLVRFTGPLGPIIHQLRATDAAAAHAEVRERFPGTLVLSPGYQLVQK